MSLFDSILGQLGGAQNLGAIASQLGLSEEQVRQAMAALGTAHPQPGDTVASAAAATGLSPEMLNQLLARIGGEGALAQVSQLIDRDGDGNPLDDIAGLAGKLFGR